MRGSGEEARKRGASELRQWLRKHDASRARARGRTWALVSRRLRVLRNRKALISWWACWTATASSSAIVLGCCIAAWWVQSLDALCWPTIESVRGICDAEAIDRLPYSEPMWLVCALDWRVEETASGNGLASAADEALREGQTQTGHRSCIDDFCQTMARWLRDTQKSPKTVGPMLKTDSCLLV